MKMMNRFAQKLMAGALAMAVFTLATQAFADNVPQFVTVLKVEGGARYSTDGGKNWTLLKKGDVLNPGSLIQTAEQGIVDVMLGDQPSGPLTTPAGSSASPTASAGGGRNGGPQANAIHIFPNSMLSVDKLTLDKIGNDETSETQLDLKAGKILGNVKKLSAASRYEVKIPNGVAGIRGTTYAISASGVIYVYDGSVVVSYVDKNGVLQTQTIVAGQSFDTTTQTLGVAGNPDPGTLPTVIINAPSNPTIDHTVYHVSPN